MVNVEDARTWREELHARYLAQEVIPYGVVEFFRDREAAEPWSEDAVRRAFMAQATDEELLNMISEEVGLNSQYRFSRVLFGCELFEGLRVTSELALDILKQFAVPVEFGDLQNACFGVLEHASGPAWKLGEEYVQFRDGALMLFSKRDERSCHIFRMTEDATSISYRLLTLLLYAIKKWPEKREAALSCFKLFFSNAWDERVRSSERLFERDPIAVLHPCIGRIHTHREPEVYTFKKDPRFVREEGVSRIYATRTLDEDSRAFQSLMWNRWRFSETCLSNKHEDIEHLTFSRSGILGIRQIRFLEDVVGSALRKLKCQQLAVFNSVRTLVFTHEALVEH